MEGRKEAFRMYLDETGTINALTQCMIKIYEKRGERPNKKDAALKFIKDNLAKDYPTRADLIKLRKEVEETRVKVAAIRKREEEAKEKAKEDAKKRAEERAKRKAAKLHQQLGGDAGATIPIADIKTTAEAKARLLDLQNKNVCTSLLIKHLAIDMIDNITDETINKKKLFDCIKPGLDNPNLPVGIYATDADAYDKFAQIFDPIINEYHSVNANQPNPLHDHWDGDAEQFVNLDETSTHVFIKSAKITCSRSMNAYPFLPAMKVDDYGKLMNEVKTAASKLSDKGAFYPLEGIDEAIKQDMANMHQLFEPETKQLKSAGVTEFSKGRAIYRNTTKDLIVWVNEEDHLKFISIDQGGDIKIAFNRLKKAVAEWEKFLQFKKNDRLGYLTFCPTNLGSTINASVIMNLPKLTGSGKNVQDVVHHLNVSVEQLPTDNLYEISNKRKLGVTEFDAVNDLHSGVRELLKEENSIEIPIDDVTSFDEAKTRLNALKNTCTSLLMQHLTDKMISDHENIATSNKKSLLDCIRPGLRDPNLSVGLYAADADAYDKFPEVFGPVVREYHGVADNVVHPVDDAWTVNDSSIKNLNPKYIKSTRITCSRSMDRKPLYPAMTDDDYLAVMNDVKPVLEKLDADLKGDFFDLELIRQSDQQLVKGSGGHVTGRAIFMNTQKTFIVWINEEDHLKFISTANEYDIKNPFERLKRAVTVECPKYGLKFASSSKWGWITSCPTNIGSTIEASVVAEFPILKARGNIEDLVKKYNLNICVKETADPSQYEISNKQKFGLLAWDAVIAMQKGVEKLIEEEEKP